MSISKKYLSDLVNDLQEMGKPINFDYEISSTYTLNAHVSDIFEPNVYLIGIYLLPIHKVYKYLIIYILKEFKELKYISEFKERSTCIFRSIPVILQYLQQCQSSQYGCFPFWTTHNKPLKERINDKIIETCSIVSLSLNEVISYLMAVQYTYEQALKRYNQISSLYDILIQNYDQLKDNYEMWIIRLNMTMDDEIKGLSLYGQFCSPIKFQQTYQLSDLDQYIHHITGGVNIEDKCSILNTFNNIPIVHNSYGIINEPYDDINSLKPIYYYY